MGIFSSRCYQTENLQNSPLQNYYFPGCPQYKTTIMEKDLGEAWFCTEKEAQAAGFTRAKNCPEKF